MEDALLRPVFIALCLIVMTACGEKTYSNIDPLEYTYSVPVSLDDGIEVASISDIGADEEILTEMIRNRLRMHFRDIDSVLIYKNE
ncbi:MAG: hypothetical protein OEX19_16615, partial [Gammaproteobacteria bacterium]|nr:hypothetical protein [Gammaproteobacteria bacterium]